ncbi:MULTISPECIES: hypothetical protein [Chryseobacterium]|uniref:Uncharacterized protein n=1 Tax=Chryseobacterium camelliae TaxID=1265445 RepID=A0ABU0TDQ7_9FLAO|nr:MULTISPECIES: hypothetical protein [Chryseobacterium]MDQ1095216.1 hypothetical protein [Chryseobacterium camelliae]MDQ1099154.1 hypothetical protein [Chryseobacterium sp. SORGH_AS_1048]MDR6086503.1 hypothetical protein [Chryseobacterium sp. SORGH_AS_0909]MDR6130874.1 hypothetical protein [Chryseobacterium sp. SORGH_AS_1175]
MFTLAVQPLLPLINYAVHYDYIVENLCENRAQPELMCNGKCYVFRQLAKNGREQASQDSRKTVFPYVDVFVAEEGMFSFCGTADMDDRAVTIFCEDCYLPLLYSRIFHPPLA